MFPIRDHNPSLKKPYVTYGLIGLNIAIFLSYWSQLQNPQFINQFFAEWGMVPIRITECVNFNQYYTVFTSMFLHGGIMHLLFNMLFLWIFGDNMEDKMGHGGFLLFYFLSGFAAGYVQLLSDPLSYVPVVGASGAIAGVMGGYLLLFPKAKIDVLIIFVIFFRIFPIPAWVMLGIWFALQLFGGFTPQDGAGGIAYWEHSGGFFFGLLFTIPLWRRLGGKAFWNKTDGRPPNPEAKYKLIKSNIPTVGNRK